MATNEAWIRTELATSKPCFGQCTLHLSYESNTCTGIFAIILLPHSCYYEHTLRFKTIPLPQGREILGKVVVYAGMDLAQASWTTHCQEIITGQVKQNPCPVRGASPTQCQTQVGMKASLTHVSADLVASEGSLWVR